MSIILPGTEPRRPADGEQRRDERFAFRLPVTLLRGREEIPLRTEDISYQGLFLETNEPLPLRHLIRLRLLLPPFHRELQTFAMAVHIPSGRRAGGVGVQLYALDRAARTVWSNFVTRVRLGDFDETSEIRFLPPEVLGSIDAVDVGGAVAPVTVEIAQSLASGITWPSAPAGVATPSR